MRLIIQRVFALAIKELLALLRDSASRAVLIGPPSFNFWYLAMRQLSN